MTDDLPPISDAEIITDIREVLATMKEAAPAMVGFYDRSRTAKIPWKAEALRAALIHRCIDISGSACDLLENGRIVPGVILTRAAMETMALICTLAKKIQDTLAGTDLAEVDKFLVSAAIGTKDPVSKKQIPVDAYNVTYIDPEAYARKVLISRRFMRIN